MCDPVTLGLGMAASGAGAFINANQANSNAAAKAQAANQSVGNNVQKLDNFGTQNEGTLGTLLNTYSPTNQTTQLTNAQTDRGNTAAGNISDPTAAGANDVPLGNAPQASKSAIAKAFLGTYDNAVSRAKALGKVGGYGDTWLTNQLTNNQAGNNIGVVNNMAEGRKALVGPEEQMAMAGTGNQHSPLGTILQGAGSILGSAAGGGLDLSSMVQSPVGYTFNGSMT